MKPAGARWEMEFGDHSEFAGAGKGSEAAEPSALSRGLWAGGMQESRSSFSVGARSCSRAEDSARIKADLVLALLNLPDRLER